MDIFDKIAVKIIEEQEIIIGPIALEQAEQVPGLTIDWNKHEISLQGDKKNVLDSLVQQYSNLFGQTSVEVCKEAVNLFKSQISSDQLPLSLR